MELLNSLSHALGVILALFLLTKSTNWFQRIFCGCMCICLMLSAYYHGILFLGMHSPIARKLDHAGIFVLIGGSATGIIRNIKRLSWLWTMIAGYVFILLIAPILPVYILTPYYLSAGLICTVMSGLEIVQGVFLLITGSIIYTTGSLINLYSYQYHLLFHLMTLIGGAIHSYLVFDRPNPIYIMSQVWSWINSIKYRFL